MSSPEEELGAPRRLLGRRTAVALGAVVVLLLGAGIVVRLSGHEHRPGPAAAPNRSGHPEVVRPTMPVAAATDALLPGPDFGDEMSGDHVTYDARLVNNTAATLTLTGPISLLGPGGEPVPHLSAELAAGWGYHPGVPLPPALAGVAPHQQVTLVVTGRRDCRGALDEAGWPARYPTVVIRLAGFASPWSVSFNFLFDGLENGNWLNGSCHGAGGPAPTPVPTSAVTP